MAKKKKQELEQDAQQQEQGGDGAIIPKDWLYNPVVYSQISGDFTMLQQRILAGVLEVIQSKILRSINEKEEGKQFPSLFSEDEMMGDSTSIEISPKKFGITPEHYDYLEDALKDLANIRIGFPKPYKDKMNYVVAPLFARLEIPMGANRRTGKVRVVMLNENIRDFFSMDKGYTEYLSRITQISKKVRTPRIYIFLTSFKDIGHKKVAYDDFCRFLGIDDETARADRLNRINQQLNNKEISQKEANERLEALTKWENPFKKWNKVKSQIIDPAKLELDTFSSDDQIDITFEYEPLYEGGKKRSNPSHIQFTVIKKRLAIEHDEQKYIKRQRHSLVQTMCDWCKDLRPYDVRELFERVEDAWLQDFSDFCLRDIRQAVEKKQPDNVAAYVMTMAENYIRDMERKHHAPKPEIEPEDMFQMKPEPEFLPGKASDRWAQLLAGADGEVLDLLRRAEYRGLRNGQFYVTISEQDSRLWQEMEPRMGEVYASARSLLGLSRFEPAIVTEVRK